MTDRQILLGLISLVIIGVASSATIVAYRVHYSFGGVGSNLAYNNALGLTESAIEDGRLSDALVFAGQALDQAETDKEKAVARYWRGFVYRRLAKTQEAQDDFLAAIEYDPRYVAPYSTLSATWLDLKDPGKAKFYAEKAIKVDPTYAWGYNNLGLAYYMLGDKVLAIKNIKYALTLDPQNALIRENLAIIESQSSSTGAPALSAGASVVFRNKPNAFSLTVPENFNVSMVGSGDPSLGAENAIDGVVVGNIQAPALRMLIIERVYVFDHAGNPEPLVVSSEAELEALVRRIHSLNLEENKQITPVVIGVMAQRTFWRFTVNKSYTGRSIETHAYSTVNTDTNVMFLANGGKVYRIMFTDDDDEILGILQSLKFDY